MKKILRYGLLVMLLLGSQAFAVSASEPDQPGIPENGTPGWYQQDGYSYYYDKKGTPVTGWMKITKDWYYFTKPGEGKAPAGSMAQGLTTIRNNKFLFRSNGKMVTGWNKKGNGKFRYFEETGMPGVIGRLCVGMKTIDADTYILNSNGVAKTGWISYKGEKYYGQTEETAGVYGRLYKSGWKKIGDFYYSFTDTGKLRTDRWVNDKFYVDESGKRLTDCVTPDGWIVDEQGKRTGKADGWVKIKDETYYYEDGTRVTGWTTIGGKKYYLGTDGVCRSGFTEVDGKQYYLDEGAVRTGWLFTEGKKYYFDEDGVMLKNTKKGGIKFDENGVADAGAAVLIIAGHGQGDPGATSTMGGVQYVEQEYTREFASLIYKKLENKCRKTAVVMYDPEYDCYQVNAGKKPGPSPDFTYYDYVLEIHFDAASRDLTGDGAYKGVSILVSTSKKDYSLDEAIVKAVVATGFKQYNVGVIKRNNLLNMNLCQHFGVSYGLLESAFIDDKDDMTFYESHKNKMANAVATTIANYFEP